MLGQWGSTGATERPGVRESGTWELGTDPKALRGLDRKAGVIPVDGGPRRQEHQRVCVEDSKQTRPSNKEKGSSSGEGKSIKGHRLGKNACRES